MNTGGGLDFKSHPKKLYSYPSARLLNKKDSSQEFFVGMTKQNRARITDHTDERNSERSQSQYAQPEPYSAGELYSGQSRVTNQGGFVTENGIRLLSEKEEKVIELRERLKNIHHFYRIRIEEERSKNIERNEIFIGIIQELQRSHSQRLVTCRKSLEELEEQKNQLGYVDERMGSVKTTIEQILMQSKELKVSNENIEKELLRKQVSVKQKEAQFLEMKAEVDGLRDKLEQFQRLKLKENKRSKELLEMMGQAQQQR